VWKKVRRFLTMGRGDDLLPSVLAALQHTLRIADELQAIIASQVEMIHSYEKLNGSLVAALSPAVAHADAGHPASWLNPNWDGVVILRKSWQMAHDHRWN
jgi:hypothetical protein